MQEREYLIARRFTALGAYLQELRIKKGLTQREVSLRLGYSSAQFISNFERGIAVPPRKKLWELKSIYGASTRRLIALVIEGRRLILADALMAKRKPAYPKVPRPTVDACASHLPRRTEIAGSLQPTENHL